MITFVSLFNDKTLVFGGSVILINKYLKDGKLYYFVCSKVMYKFDILKILSSKFVFTLSETAAVYLIYYYLTVR